MLFSRRTLLASLGITLPVAAAEAASRNKKGARASAKHATAHHARASRTRRTAPAVPAQS